MIDVTMLFENIIALVLIEAFVTTVVLTCRERVGGGIDYD